MFITFLQQILIDKLILAVTISKKVISTVSLNYNFFFEKQTHKQGRGKKVLTQKHITTPLISHNLLPIIYYKSIVKILHT